MWANPCKHRLTYTSLRKLLKGPYSYSLDKTKSVGKRAPTISTMQSNIKIGTCINKWREAVSQNAKLRVMYLIIVLLLFWLVLYMKFIKAVPWLLIIGTPKLPEFMIQGHLRIINQILPFQSSIWATPMGSPTNTLNEYSYTYSKWAPAYLKYSPGYSRCTFLRAFIASALDVSIHSPCTCYLLFFLLSMKLSKWRNSTRYFRRSSELFWWNLWDRNSQYFVKYSYKCILTLCKKNI